MSIKKALVISMLILLIDQISKVYVKTHFVLGSDYAVFNWFRFYFVENSGMAWGATLSDLFPFIPDRTAKVSLTIFRIFAITGIGYWLVDTIKKGYSKVLSLALTFVFAGALGNILDSVFYGVLFSDSYEQVAVFLPNGGGYDKLLYGKVVDMLYFPVYDDFLPSWIPFFGGEEFTFFQPVFNIADVAISVGFVVLVIYNKKLF